MKYIINEMFIQIVTETLDQNKISYHLERKDEDNMILEVERNL